MMVEPEANNEGTSGSEVSEERTGPCKINKCLESVIVWK